MRRIVLAICMTATSLVLLFGYRTSLPGRSPSPVAAASAPDGGGNGATPSATAPPDTAPSAAPATYRGSQVQTRWGPVQVQITVSGGKVTAATAVQVPDGNQRDVQINGRAVPQLNAEVVQAQAGDIDTVSGATVTSEGYIGSLQSALDAAGL